MKWKTVVLAAACLAGSGTSAQVRDGDSAAGERAAERQRYEAMPDTVGTGPYRAVKTTDAAFPGYVVYRPADLSRLGKRKLAVLAWGNGGCSADGASARLQLAEIASHGFLVLAPGAIRSGLARRRGLSTSRRRPGGG